MTEKYYKITHYSNIYAKLVCYLLLFCWDHKTSHGLTFWESHWYHDQQETKSQRCLHSEWDLHSHQDLKLRYEQVSIKSWNVKTGTSNRVRLPEFWMLKRECSQQVAFPSHDKRFINNRIHAHKREHRRIVKSRKLNFNIPWWIHNSRINTARVNRET